MTSTLSDGTPQVLTALGPCLPVIVTLDAQQATLPPGIFVAPSADSNLEALIEVTASRPDTNGNLPTNAMWVPYCPKGFVQQQGVVDGVMGNGTGLATAGNNSQAQVGRLDVTITAIRARITAYLAGSLTFAVTQNTIPRMLVRY